MPLTKGHNVVMHEDTEDKMFKDLLSDYAAPTADNGFSEKVMANLEPRPDHTRLKALMVGGAGLIGAVIAGLQLPGFWNYLTGISVPDIQPLPTAQIETGLLSTSYGMAAVGIILLLGFWVGNNVLFGEDM